MKDARQAAQGLASLGRGEDSVLVHMTPGEVQGLQALAMAHGGSLTINPETGLAEAGFLKSLLPTVVGLALAPFTAGMSLPWLLPTVAGAATGALTGDKDLSLLMRAGLGALGGFGGSGIASALTSLSPGVGGEAFLSAATEAGAKPAITGEAMKQGAANLVKEGGFKAFTQAMPLGKFGLAAAAAPTIADMMQPPEYDVPKGTSGGSKFYVGKGGQPLWRPGTYNPETGVFEGQGWNDAEYVYPYPGMEDETQYAASGGHVRRFADGGSTSTSTAPFNYTPEQLAQIQAAIGDVPNWGLTALTGGTGISGTTIGGGQIAPTTQSTAQSTIQPASTSVASVQPTALPTNFYSQIETAGPTEAWRWLRSNTQGLTLPTDWNTDEWTTGEKNKWLLANYPGIDPEKFETARDIYRSGKTTNTNTNISTEQAAKYYYRDPSTGEYKPFSGSQSSTVPLYTLAGGDYYPTNNTWKQDLPDTMREYYRGLFTPEGSLPAPRSAAPLAQYMADVNARLAKPYVPPAPPKSPLASDVNTMGGFMINPLTGGMMFIPRGTTIPEAALKAGDNTVAGITGEDWMNFIKNLSSGGKDTTEGGEDTLEGGGKEPYQPPALANNFYDLIRTQGQSQAFAWLRQNIGNYDKLPSGWSNMTIGEKNLWLKQNYPGIDKAAFDAAQAAYVKGQQSGGNTGGRTDLYSPPQGGDVMGPQPPTRQELWSQFWGSLSQAQKTAYSKPANRTAAGMNLSGDQAAAWNAYQKALGRNYEGGQIHSYAQGGGIGSLRTYAAGGKLLNGPGDGMSDSIPAVIQGPQQQRAALADGEFVVPADVVSHLGNGSTNAGAQRLYSMMDKVRQARTGKQSQAPAINPNKYLA